MMIDASAVIVGLVIGWYIAELARKLIKQRRTNDR